MAFYYPFGNKLHIKLQSNSSACWKNVSNVDPLVPMQYEQVFIGISRRELNVRPAAFFFMKCSLSSKEIQQLYSTAQDSFESTRLYTVPMVGSILYLTESLTCGSFLLNN